jgi:hypothetical protein
MLKQPPQFIGVKAWLQPFARHDVTVDAVKVIHDDAIVRDFRLQSHLFRPADARPALPAHPAPDPIDPAVEWTHLLDY